MPDVRKILADPKFQQMDIEERRKVLLSVDGERFGAMPREEQDKVLGTQIGAQTPQPTSEIARKMMGGLIGGADAKIEARPNTFGSKLSQMVEQIAPALSRADEAIRNFYGGVHPDPVLEAIASGKREPLMKTPMLATSELANAIPSGDQVRKPSVVIDPLAEEAMAMSQAVKPVAKGLLKSAEFMTMPENAVILGLSSAAGNIPAVGKALTAAFGAGFDAMMISQAIESVPELKERFESGDIEGAIAASTELLAAGAMGAHGLKDKARLTRRQPGMTARPLESQNARLAVEEAMKLTPAQLEQRNRELQQQGSTAVADVQQVAHEEKLQDGAYNDLGRKAVRRKADELRPEMPRSAAMLDDLARQKKQPAGREGRPSNTDEIGAGELRRAQREEVTVPETGSSLEDQQMVDRMERLAEGYGKPFEELKPEEQDEVFQLAKEGYSNPETTRKRVEERAKNQELADEMDRVASELGVKFDELSPEDQKAVHLLAKENVSGKNSASDRSPGTVDLASKPESPKPDNPRDNPADTQPVEQPQPERAQEIPSPERSPREPKTPPTYGRQTEVLIPGEKKKYLGAYALREAEDVIPSHNAHSFEPRAEYEFNNDRDYSQPQNAERVVKQTAEFDPAYLVNDNPTAENGPPIIDSRGNVLGGNSRTMTLERARRNPQAAEAYRQELRSQAKKLGLDPAAVDKLKNPVLVRELVDVPDAQKAITDLNKVGTAELRQAERAVADSRRVSTKTLEEIAGRIEDQGPDGTLAKALEGDSRAIIDRLTEDGVLTVQERPRLMNGDGRLTAEGKQRVSRLMVGRLFEDARHFEDAAPELKAKLERVVPSVAQLEGKGEWDIGNDLRSAIQLVEEARTRDLAIDELTAQRGMFGDRNYSRDAIAIAKLLKDGKPTEIVKRFRQFASEAAMAESDQGMLGMEAPTREESFSAAFAEDRGQTARSADAKIVDTAERPLYELNPEELRGVEKRAELQDKQGLDRAFGRDGAKRYRELERQANGGNKEVRAAAEAEMRELERESGLSRKDLDRILYGIGEEATVDAAEVQRYRNALESLNFDSEEALGADVARAMIEMGSERNPKLLTRPGQKIAYAKLRYAFEQAGQLGLDTRKISAAALRSVARQVTDSEDARLLLEGFERRAGAIAKVNRQVYQSGALSLVRPEEVRINYAKGKPTLTEIETGARVKYFAPKGDRPAIVSLNDQAMQVVNRILGTGRASGLAIPELDSLRLRAELANRIRKSSGEAKSALSNLYEAIDKMANANRNGNLVVVEGHRGVLARELMKTLREELTHYEQFGLSESHAGQAAHEFQTYLPQWAKIDAYLNRNGYGNQTEATRVMEGAAQIAAGRWKDMGLSPLEAVTWFGQYVEGASYRHGKKASRVTRWAEKEIRDGYEKWRTERERNRDYDRKQREAEGTDSRGTPDPGGDPAQSRIREVGEGAGARLAERPAGVQKDQRGAGTSGADNVATARANRSNERDGLREVRGDGEGDQGPRPRKAVGVDERSSAERERAGSRRGVAEYLASKRGESVTTHPETDARAKVPTTKGGGGRIGDTSSPKTSTPSPDPGRSKKPPEVAPKSPASPEREIPVSPSYDQTRDNLIDRVGLDNKTKKLVRGELSKWEKNNPERQAVSFADIAEEAKAYDPRLILELDRKRAQDILVTDGAMRFAARNAQHAIAKEIGTLSAQLSKESVVGGERQRLERKREQLENDFQKLTDVLIPTRSQIGRMLAYENMMAEQSFDVTYWLQRARKAQSLPEGVSLPDKDIEKIRTATEKGQAAEDAAVDRVQQPKSRQEIERQAAEELAAEGILDPSKEGKEAPSTQPRPKSRLERAKAATKINAEKSDVSREELVAKARQALLDRLDNALIDAKTAKVDPISPEERQLWEQDPEVIVRRAKLANYRQELLERKNGPPTREKEVERKRLEFIARLEARAKGKELSVDPVKPEERALWENDPRVLELRAEIAQKFPPPPEPTLAEKQDRYRKQLMERIDRIAKGEKQERKTSKWQLTPEQRKLVENDPQVRAAARELARLLQEQRKDGWLTYIGSLRSAGLLSAPATHIRNITSNAAFQIFNEASRPMAMVADFAIRNLAKDKAIQERTVAGVDLKAVQAASREGALKGYQEAKEIMKTGEVRNGDTALFDFTRELNAKHLFEQSGIPGLKHLAFTNDAINLVFRSLKAEDRFFKRYAYERSLREQMELAKVKVPTDEMMVQAWTDADFATFNNENLAAKALNQGLSFVEKRGPMGKLSAFAVKLFLPFRNTPANVWMRGLESMGGGVLTGSIKILAHEGKLTAAQQRGIAMEMGRGATGLGLLTLGFIAARNGFITGMTPEDERGKKGVQQAAGRPDGSIRVGKQWVSITGLSPLANVLLVGATLARRYDDPLAFLSNADEALAVFNSTVKDQPMLRGLNDMIDAFQNKDNRMGTMVSSMAGSFVPSIANSVGQLTDSKRRDARGSNMIERAGKAVMARTPGLRQMLPERLDVMGRPLEQSRLGATLGFPVETESDNPVLKEMVRVGVSMAEGKRHEGEKKTDYELRIAEARKAGLEKPERLAKETDEEFAARQAAIGDSVLKRVERLMNSSKYQAMNVVEQQHAIEQQISSARKRAAAAVKRRAYEDVPIEGKRAWLRERIGR